MNLADTSLAAFRTIDLDRREREVLAHIEQHFPSAEFTRAELAQSIGWAVNRITGRVLGLIEKGRLTEDGGRTVECSVTQGRAHPVRLSNSMGRPEAVNSAMRANPQTESVSEQETRLPATVAQSGSSPDRPSLTDTSSESHRHACEVLYVAAMNSDNERRLFLEGVRQKRGEAAWKRLRQDVWTALQRVAA